MTDITLASRDIFLERAPAYSPTETIYIDLDGIDMAERARVSDAVVVSPDAYDPSAVATALRAIQTRYESHNPLHTTIEAVITSLPPAKDINAPGLAQVRDAAFLLEYLGGSTEVCIPKQRKADIRETAPRQLEGSDLLRELKHALANVTIANPAMRTNAQFIVRDLKAGHVPEARLADAAVVLGHILRQPHIPS